jgi:hypothetical protein
LCPDGAMVCASVSVSVAQLRHSPVATSSHRHVLRKAGFAADSTIQWMVTVVALFADVLMEWVQVARLYVIELLRSTGRNVIAPCATS